MSFKQGQGGRKKGARNKATYAATAVAIKLVEDKEYRKAFAVRFKSGTLPAALEAMVWHYAYGKPVEHLEHSGADGGPVQHTVTFKRPEQLSAAH